jgi:hypothetical protein
MTYATAMSILRVTATRPAVSYLKIHFKSSKSNSNTAAMNYRMLKLYLRKHFAFDVLLLTKKSKYYEGYVSSDS